ncbi:MAG: TonB-dependent receptor domain-containing protein [Terriglobia bacterium]
MLKKITRIALLVAWMAVAVGLCAQDPTGTIEGRVSDASGAVIPGAVVRVTQLATGIQHSQTTDNTGSFAFPFLPVGIYGIDVEASGFTAFRRNPVPLSINERARVNAELQVAATHETIQVEAAPSQIDTSTNVLGKVVSGREILDLPLNGRNFTQLGLLQVGVVPLTQGVLTAGGSLRANQAYAVNGQRPESNNYLLDGAHIVDKVDGAFALRVPVDAITEFRILTHTAPPEYGGTSGATTSVVTRSGSNEFHGSVYEFFRNDVFDARNFFSESVEPLKQNQFGATVGGPVIHNRTFFFGYYEGFRNRQGITKTATVPTPEQRLGDFSQLGQPLFALDFNTGQFGPYQGLVPINPISEKVLEFYPLGNVAPNLFRTTQIMRNNSDQAGVRLDHQFSDRDSLSGRYSYGTGSNVNPLSIKGADVPGFPVGDDLTTQSATISENHSFSGRTFNTLRASYFRHAFLFDQRFNRTPPRDLGFQYDTTLAAAEGPPFFIVNGYASVGDPITGPRDTVQNTFELNDSLAHIEGRHTLKFGGEYRRNQINAVQGIASNGFFVFVPFPFSDPFASFLAGMPIVFFQAGGDLQRYLRTWELAGYAQDEWRYSSRLTLNFGLRYEISTPYSETNERLNAFVPGAQSSVFSNAPEGLLFPGDDGVTDRISPIYKRGWMPRVGFAWDPTGAGRLSIRGGYGVFYDPFANGTGGPLQAAISALPWTQAQQVPGPFLNYADPFNGQPPFDISTFPRPMTILTNEVNMKPAYAQNWNISVQRSFAGSFLLDVRYVGTKGTHLPRFVEANPAVYGPGATIDNADQRRIYAGCPSTPGPCTYGSVGLLTNSTDSTYHAGQISVSRRFSNALGFLASYTYSKTLDYVSSLNLSGSAPRLVSGENDLAQNPFDLAAEHGPSLFDARHRLTLSAIIELPRLTSASPATRAVLGGWQINTIVIASTATPFTVYDSANVALQGSHPEISGFSEARPDVVGDVNLTAPHTPEQWISRSAFRRLDPNTEAGEFGNAGRNIARGPAYGSLDVGLSKGFKLGETANLQFRAESFNLTNHANFALPENDLASPNFGRILVSGPPRLMQFALKLLF